MDTADWSMRSEGKPMGTCPCGEPLDGHHHWDGYWSWRGRQQLIEAMFPELRARVTQPKIHYELQRREVLTVLEYAAYLTMARTLGPNYHAIAVLGANY